jgi:hypothetical protein
MAPHLEYDFTLHVDLEPPLDYGPTSAGYKRFIPISGGKITGQNLQGTILAHTGED